MVRTRYAAMFRYVKRHLSFKKDVRQITSVSRSRLLPRNPNKNRDDTLWSLCSFSRLFDRENCFSTVFDELAKWIPSNIACFAHSKCPEDSRCSSATNSSRRHVNPHNLLLVTRWPLRTGLVETQERNVCVKPTSGVSGEPHPGRARFQRSRTDLGSPVHGSIRFYDGIFVRRLRRGRREPFAVNSRRPTVRDQHIGVSLTKFVTIRVYRPLFERAWARYF